MTVMIWQITGIFLILLVINLLLWKFAMPGYVSRRLLRFQNELVNRHYAEVEAVYREMRGWRHDYHNHIQTLKAYMSLTQYEEVIRYLESLDKDLTSVDTLLRTGNIMIDAILNSKLSLIQKRDIKTDVTAVVPGEIPVSDVDLAVLIGNLLDNAMEACAKVPVQDRFIRIYIDVLKKQLYIAVTNSMEGRPGRRGDRFLSDKQGSHGFGLMRIDDIVKRNGGFINRQTEEGVFATEVTLPLIKP